MAPFSSLGESKSKMEDKFDLSSARLVVVKIGSTLVLDTETSGIRNSWLESLIEDVARLLTRGQQVVLVSSGAVAIGSTIVDRLDAYSQVGHRQAAAALGQVQLTHSYSESLKRHGLQVAQLLIGRGDLVDPDRRLNTRAVLLRLIDLGAVPLVNENDTTATCGTRVGDNDRLAAWIAEIINADLLILLSNVDGLFMKDPRNDPLTLMLTEVESITREIEAMATQSVDPYSSGGMISKIEAGKIAMNAGCRMIIANGTRSHPLYAIESGGPSTHFIPSHGIGFEGG
ncbi:glutamate 5-kinase [Sinorhizobium meliloti]|uniref:glutamate 5-kinase n=1 Tax=Rhizobium meliloti TaxID=382 RepID=UPI00307D67E7